MIYIPLDWLTSGYVSSDGACGDRSKTMSGRLVKVVEFSHLGEFYSFDRENKGYAKRNTQNEITVCVAFDIT